MGDYGRLFGWIGEGKTISKNKRAAECDMWDILIKGGEVIDGTGAPRVRLDVAVEMGRIGALGRLDRGSSRKVIDAAGKIVSPGFIDMHSHSDLLVLHEPTLPSKIRQGVTTELVGQDGLSVTPITGRSRNYIRKRVSGLNGNFDLDWDWGSLGDYLSSIADRHPAGNIAALTGHGTVRASVMGAESRPTSEDELQAMERSVEECLDDGAFGISTGLIYPPCTSASQEELVRLCRTTGRHGGFVAVHMRSEGDLLLEAFEEILAICNKAEAALHISHLKAVGQRNWHKMERLLEAITRARAEGIDLTFDHYPYNAGSTMLDALIPPWHHQGGVESLLDRLSDSGKRATIKADIAGPSLPWENWVSLVGWENIVIASVASAENKWAEGRRISNLAEMLHKEPADVVMDLIYAEKGAVSMILFWGDEHRASLPVGHPAYTVGTDGVPGSRPHPRLFGTYPRILGRYVREEKLLSIEKAIEAMTGKPARRLGLSDRGLIKEGFWADLVIFDPTTVIDRSSFDDPMEFPEGIQTVIVNGTIAMHEGIQSTLGSGQILRRGSS